MAESVLQETTPAVKRACSKKPIVVAGVRLQLVIGERTYPVDYEAAQKITGYGPIRMAGLIGAIDAKQVNARATKGELTSEQVSALLPTKAYDSIRVTIRE